MSATPEAAFNYHYYFFFLKYYLFIYFSAGIFFFFFALCHFFLERKRNKEDHFSTVDRLWSTDRNTIRTITQPPTDAYIDNVNIPLACSNPISEDSIMIIIKSIKSKWHHLARKSCAIWRWRILKPFPSFHLILILGKFHCEGCVIHDSALEWTRFRLLYGEQWNCVEIWQIKRWWR